MIIKNIQKQSRGSFPHWFQVQIPWQCLPGFSPDAPASSHSPKTFICVWIVVYFCILAPLRVYPSPKDRWDSSSVSFTKLHEPDFILCTKSAFFIGEFQYLLLLIKVLNEVMSFKLLVYLIVYLFIFWQWGGEELEPVICLLVVRCNPWLRMTSSPMATLVPPILLFLLVCRWRKSGNCRIINLDFNDVTDLFIFLTICDWGHTKKYNSTM